ncbi:MAG: hypothetical protein CVU59_07220 [Deltaproteobacteria bacterium HGW-Deltaproteobacteria-17]|nr:MAG: hypothetical protein CVU59_07220 [Deltaproteobacteria bacterium HGW-Deltaproteobacteria-17]
MNRSRRWCLWISFFLTANVLFFPVAFLSTLYWMNTVPVAHVLLGSVAASIAFSAIIATHKYRALTWIQARLDFSRFDRPAPRILEKELTRLGYRVSGDETVFIAGFRADYYLAPEIRASWEGAICDLEGPAFYVRKLEKRNRRAIARLDRKIRQMTDGQTPPS